MEKGLDELSYRIIGAAIEVHRILGPGLLESAYRDCLCRELEIRDIGIEKEAPLDVTYKGIAVLGYRADIIAEKKVIIELKSVASLDPVAKAQLLSYLRVAGLRVGLLINFNVTSLVKGIYRVVNGFI